MSAPLPQLPPLATAMLWAVALALLSRRDKVHVCYSDRELRCLLFEIPQKPAPYIIILYDPTSLSLGGLEWALVEFCAESLHSLHVLFKLYK